MELSGPGGTRPVSECLANTLNSRGEGRAQRWPSRQDPATRPNHSVPVILSALRWPANAQAGARRCWIDMYKSERRAKNLHPEVETYIKSVSGYSAQKA